MYTMSKIEQIKMPMDIIQPRAIKLTKHSELEDAVHPGNIDEGCVVIGEFMHEPEVGYGFWVRRENDHWRTSVVTEIINDNMFKTLNSIYVWEDVNFEQSINKE